MGGRRPHPPLTEPVLEEGSHTRSAQVPGGPGGNAQLVGAGRASEDGDGQCISFWGHCY